MKNSQLIKHVLITLLIVNVFHVSAQNIRGGLILGVNVAQVDGDNYGGFAKPGLNAGAMAELPITNYNLLLRMDLLFSQKGAASALIPGQASNGIVNAYSLTLNYVEIPITINYVYRKKYGIGFGLSLARLVGGSFDNYGLEYPILTSPPPGVPQSNILEWYYQPWDINIILDGLYLIDSKHWMANLRWMYSMRFISKNYGDGATPTQPATGPSHFYNYGEFNNVLALRVIYVFGTPQK